MAHTPPSPGQDRIDRLIDGAMQEVAELSWDTCAASGSRSPNEPPQTVAPPVADAFPGYQVLKEIRAGGQAVVYLGVEQTTDRRVAIKAFRPSSIPTPKDRYRFEREVEALQDLVHPNIVRILHADASGTSPFIVMEYVPGWNLDEYFREHDLDVRATMRLFRTIALAIHAAHQKGVIHRDIKPTNIRVDHNNEPHVLDFGLARLDSSPTLEPTMTETGQFLGTLHWVSPEQAEGRVQDVDVRTDVYSLGVVLYNMLTGELPFEQGGSMRDVLNRIATAEPVPPSKWRREIDDDVETIVLKCLAKEPARRYTSAAALGEDVKRWLEGQPIEAKRDSWGYVAAKFAQRHWLSSALALAFFGLTIAVAVGFGWHQSEMRRVSEQTIDITTTYAESTEWLLRGPLDQSEAERARLVNLIRLVDQLRSGSDRAQCFMRPTIAIRCALCGFHDLAYEQSEAALNATERRFGNASEEYASAAFACADHARQSGNIDAALDISARAMAAAQRLDPTNTDAPIGACTVRSTVCLERGLLDESEQVARAGVDASRAWGKDDPARLAHKLKTCADTLYAIVSRRKQLGMSIEPLFEYTLELNREALQHARLAYGPDHEEVLAHNVHSYAVQLREAGRFQEADPLAREAVELRRRSIPPCARDSYWLYSSIGSLGVLRMYQGNFDAAQSLLNEAVTGLQISNAPVFTDLRVKFHARLDQLHSCQADGTVPLPAMISPSTAPRE